MGANCCYWIALHVAILLRVAGGHSLYDETQSQSFPDTEDTTERQLEERTGGIDYNQCFGHCVRDKYAAALTAPSGEISSPSYTYSHIVDYPNNADCSWTIDAPAKAIVLRFGFFELDGDANAPCNKDRVELRDANDKVLGVNCASNPPTGYIKSYGKLKVRFVSNPFGVAAGFLLHWETEDIFMCQSPYMKISAEVGVSADLNLNAFVDMDQDGSYDSDKHCAWVIEAPHGMVVKLTFVSFDMEEGRTEECEYDHLEITDEERSKTLRKHCGSRLPFKLTTSGRTMRLVFKTDGAIVGRGVSMQYEAVAPMPDCGFLSGNRIGEASEQEWPWVVEVQALINPEPEEWHYVSTGTIIKNEWVLAAASAVADYTTLRIVIVKTGEVIDVSSIHQHPWFRAEYNFHDLTLLQLSSPLTFSDSVRPICLSITEPEDRSTCTVVAMGNIGSPAVPVGTQRNYAIEYISQDSCQKPDFLGGKFRYDKICSLPKEAGDKYCSDDTGGPLFCEDSTVLEGLSTTYSLQGTIPATVGENQCTQASDGPEQFINTRYYHDWIDEHTGVYPLNKMYEGDLY